MRSYEILCTAALAALVCASALIFTGCGGDGHRASSIPSIGDTGSLAQAPQEISVEAALAELEAMEGPEGVEAGLFQQLKDELARQLAARGAGKAVCIPPTGEGNQVRDLAVADNGDGSFNLTWHYWNVGDYNQDGSVSIADITPIAAHFDEVVPPEDTERVSIQAVVDGSGDGIINSADLTPIGQNMGVYCAGYIVYQAPSAEGPWESVFSVPLANASGEGRLGFNLDVVPGIGMRFIMVVPHDGQETGVASVPAVLPGEEPVVVSVTPLSGTEGEQVTFAAEVTGTPPFDYAWDFAGAVEGADAAAAGPTGTWGPVGTYDACTLTVTNSFGETTFGFTLTVRRWYVVTVADMGGTGCFPSLAVVDGRPAISYCNFSEGALMFVRAEDADGEAWGAPYTVDDEGQAGYFSSLAVVGGTPAIAYCEYESGSLKYVRASDAAGDSWGTPVVAAAGAGAEYINLATAGNEPAILYYNWFAGDLMFALSAGGSTWNAPVTVDSAGIVGKHASLAIVNGFPAATYGNYPNGDLKYVRAAEESGATWEIPMVVDYRGDVGWWGSLAVVDGRPAISFCDRVAGALCYVRADDADGAAWGSPMTVDVGDTGAHTSLAVVNGTPAIAYFAWGSGDLKYASAADAEGSEWNPPQTVDGNGVVGAQCRLLEVNGHPAIAYYDSTNADLKYAAYH